MRVRNCRRNSDYRTVLGLCGKENLVPVDDATVRTPLEQSKIAPRTRSRGPRQRAADLSKPMEFAKSDNTNLAAGTRPDYTYPEDPSWTPPPLPEELMIWLVSTK